MKEGPRTWAGASSPLAMTGNAKLFAFTGEDIGAISATAFNKFKREGVDLLALDSDAFSFCHQKKLPCTTLADWIGDDGITLAKERASRWENVWYRPGGDFLSAYGVCWPELDREAMFWFWRTASTALALAESLVSRGIGELLVVDRSPAPAVYYAASDVHLALWRQVLQGRVQIRSIKPARGSRPARRTVTRARSAAVRTIRMLRPVASGSAARGTRPELTFNRITRANAGALSGKVVIALNPGELYRQGPIIADLTKRFPGDVVIIPTVPWAGDLEAFGLEHGIEVLNIEPVEEKGAGVPEKFTRDFETLAGTTTDSALGQVLHACRHHFDYYLATRWPLFASAFAEWEQVLTLGKPLILAVSSLEDAESQLPAVAARKVALPSVTLPHGPGITRPTRLHASVILHAFETDLDAMQRSGNDGSVFRGCRDYMPKNEYPVAKGSGFANGGSAAKVLVLLAATFRPGIIWPAIELHCQSCAIASLFQKPVEAEASVQFLLKPHPNLPDLAFLHTLGPEIQAVMLPPGYPLEDAIESADLVLALNYSGIGIVHAALKQKPVVFFWNDPALGKTDPYPFADIYLPCGPLVRSPAELWFILERFSREPGYRSELTSQASRFAQTHLNNDGYQTVAEIVADIIGNANSARFARPDLSR